MFASLTVEENLRLVFRQRGGRQCVPDALDRAYEAFPVLGERRRQHGGTLSGGRAAHALAGQGAGAPAQPAGGRRDLARSGPGGDRRRLRGPAPDQPGRHRPAGGRATGGPGPRPGRDGRGPRARLGGLRRTGRRGPGRGRAGDGGPGRAAHRGPTRGRGDPPVGPGQGRAPTAAPPAPFAEGRGDTRRGTPPTGDGTRRNPNEQQRARRRHRRRGPDDHGQAGWGPGPLAPGRPARLRPDVAGGADGHRPGDRRRRHRGLRHPGGGAEHQRHPQRAGCRPACPRACRPPPWTGSAARPSRPCTSPRPASRPATTTWWWPVASR